MDFDAILDALDQRTRSAIKAATEPLLSEIARLEKQLEAAHRAAENQRAADWSAIEARDATLSDRIDELAGDAQKQVREALARAPIPTYKGVFDKDTEYQAGDMVTHDGSVWHCNSPAAGEKPGGNEFWTLAVKRGRDGKDATKDAE